MLATAEAVTLHTLLATYPTTAALKRGEVGSPLVHLDFADVRQANTAFKALVRDEKFDVGELAIVTYLQAKAFGTAYALLPVVVVGRSQHHSLLYNPARGHLDPADLANRRVGVRAYTQTTGAWVRAILEQDHGVDFTRVRWVTFEEPHLREFRDPPWVERAPAGKSLQQMLVDGELDAAIFGNEVPGAPLQPLIPDADAAAAAWAALHGGTPINHMMVIRKSIATSRPEIVGELYRLLLESRNAAGGSADHQAIRFGVENNRHTLELIIEYSVRQGLIPRRMSVDELFDETAHALEAA
jgi:4,5-dihydroxyphthalate decarboxylase